MARRTSAITTVAAMALLLPWSLASAAVDPATGMPLRLIVRFDDAGLPSSASAQGDPAARAASKQAAMQARVDGLSAITARPLKLIRTLASGALLVDAGDGADATDLTAMAARIRAGAPNGLRYVEPDRVLQATLTPNDPYLPDLWGLAGPAQSYGFAGINAYPAWERSRGSGAVVGIIDTGYRPHADLAGQIVAQYDFIADAGNANDGDGRDADAQDPGDFRTAGACGSSGSANSSWHGTHVAGTIAALANNALGVAGVAYEAKLVIARVLGRCGGMTSDISDAIVWASGGVVPGVPPNPRPANVLNLSLGGPYPCSSSPEMQNAINDARSRNTTIVVAAGNSNADASGFTPASCSGVIAVAAVGDGGSRAPYSNYGSGVSVAAPGGDTSRGGSYCILSTYNTGTTTPGTDTYAYMQGTSMASPHVAGVAALLYALQPSLTPDAVAAAIRDHVRPFPSGCAGCGSGLVDATLALASVAPGSGTLGFASTGFTVAENGGSATITVQRIGGSAGAVSVAYATSNGSAIAGSDYTARSGTLSWADGDSAAKSFSVPILDDTIAEPTETVNLALSSPTGGATLGTARSAVLSIADNDSAPGTLALGAATYAVAENAGGVTVTVTRTGGANGPVSVAYSTVSGTATAGSDYTETRGTLSWASGDTVSKTFRVPILDNTVVEGSEAFQVRLGPVTGASLGSPSTATVTITDNDVAGPAGTLAFTGTAWSIGEGAGLATITVQRTGGSAGIVKVNYASSNGTATAGSDYAAVSGTLTWAAGDTGNKSFTVPIIDDKLAEPAETLNLTLSAPTGGATLGTAKAGVLTIVDNDAPGTIVFGAASYSVSEGGGSVAITVLRTGGAVGAASVSYATIAGSATAGRDFTAKTGTLTWASNETAARTIVIPIVNDTVREGSESFQIRLSGPVTATLGSPSSTTVTIIDND